MLAKLLMHTEEVDFCHLNSFVVQLHHDRNTRDERVEALLVFISTSDTDNPLRLVARYVQCPSQESNRVVESELATVVFNVVVSKQLIEFLTLFLVLEVNHAPLVSCW